MNARQFVSWLTSLEATESLDALARCRRRLERATQGAPRDTRTTLVLERLAQREADLATVEALLAEE